MRLFSQTNFEVPSYVEPQTITDVKKYVYEHEKKCSYEIEENTLVYFKEYAELYFKFSTSTPKSIKIENNTIHVDLSDDIAQYFVYNMLGKLVKQGKITKGNNEIYQITNDNVYLVRLKSNQNSQTYKISIP